MQAGTQLRIATMQVANTASKALVTLACQTMNAARVQLLEAAWRTAKLRVAASSAEAELHVGILRAVVTSRPQVPGRLLQAIRNADFVDGDPDVLACKGDFSGLQRRLLTTVSRLGPLFWPAKASFDDSFTPWTTFLACKGDF